MQSFGTTRDVLVRVLPEEGKDVNQVSEGVLAAIRSYVPGVELRRTEAVGSQVGKELAQKGALAGLFTFIFIAIYVALRFQWKLALGSVIAAMHDPIVVLGFFAATQMTFDLPTLAAILAVVGYSLNDTVVVFDRIRERFGLSRKDPPAKIIDMAVNETLSRTMMTSVTTMLAVLSLLLFGGDVLEGVCHRAGDRRGGGHFLVHICGERHCARLQADGPRSDARPAREGRRRRTPLNTLSHSREPEAARP